MTMTNWYGLGHSFSKLDYFRIYRYSVQYRKSRSTIVLSTNDVDQVAFRAQLCLFGIKPIRAIHMGKGVYIIKWLRGVLDL